MFNEIMLSEDGRIKMGIGIRKLTSAVSSTMGPKGRNVLIQIPNSKPVLTKDGVTVSLSINLKDPIESMGAKIVQEAATLTNDIAGDGTTTSTVLAHRIFIDGLALLKDEKINPVGLKRGMEMMLTKIVEALKEQSKPISTDLEIEQVATISANGDKVMGKTIADAILKVGKEGVVSITKGEKFEDEIEIINGMEYDQGYSNPNFVTDSDRMEVTFSKPLILIIDDNLNTLQHIIPLLETVAKAGQQLLLIANSYSEEVMKVLVANKLQNILQVCAAHAPGIGDNAKAFLRDIAVTVGGKVFSPDNGDTQDVIDESYLGTAASVTVTKDKTIIIGGEGDEEDISTRIEIIKGQLEHAVGKYDKNILTQRIAKLSGGIAVLKVGGVSVLEVGERKDRFDDALAATRAAIEGGISTGGGYAFQHAVTSLNSTLSETFKGVTADELSGINLLKSAVTAPLTQILSNAGINIESLPELKSLSREEGIDANSGKVVNMFENGIIDPTKVEITALTNAVAVASSLLTTEAIVYLTKED